MKDLELINWINDNFQVSSKIFIKALKMSPSAQGYIHGAISELMLVQYLMKKGYEVKRIKEKPSGGFDEKKIGYKGDFLINKKGSQKFYVIECKGLKSNAEFRAAKTDDEHKKTLSCSQAYNFLKKYYSPNLDKIYLSGYDTYLKAKEKWEIKNKKSKFPPFKWNKNFPGPDSVDLSSYFKSLKELKQFVYNCDPVLLTEESFRNKKGLYKVLQTHKPSKRIDSDTGISQAAPLVSDFSILAVDLFLRTGKHEFVFVNPEVISHSPSSPKHLYQNYIIDILIPNIKDELTIKYPWFTDICNCIKKTSPKTVEYDDTQLDFRDSL